MSFRDRNRSQDGPQQNQRYTKSNTNSSTVSHLNTPSSLEQSDTSPPTKVATMQPNRRTTSINGCNPSQIDPSAHINTDQSDIRSDIPLSSRGRFPNRLNALDGPPNWNHSIEPSPSLEMSDEIDNDNDRPSTSSHPHNFPRMPHGIPSRDILNRPRVHPSNDTSLEIIPPFGAIGSSYNIFPPSPIHGSSDTNPSSHSTYQHTSHSSNAPRTTSIQTESIVSSGVSHTNDSTSCLEVPYSLPGSVGYPSTPHAVSLAAPSRPSRPQNHVAPQGIASGVYSTRKIYTDPTWDSITNTRARGMTAHHQFTDTSLIPPSTNIPTSATTAAPSSSTTPLLPVSSPISSHGSSASSSHTSTPYEKHSLYTHLSPASSSHNSTKLVRPVLHSTMPRPKPLAVSPQQQHHSTPSTRPVHPTSTSIAGQPQLPTPHIRKAVSSAASKTLPLDTIGTSGSSSSSRSSSSGNNSKNTTSTYPQEQERLPSSVMSPLLSSTSPSNTDSSSSHLPIRSKLPGFDEDDAVVFSTIISAMMDNDATDSTHKTELAISQLQQQQQQQQQSLDSTDFPLLDDNTNMNQTTNTSRFTSLPLLQVNSHHGTANDIVNNTSPSNKNTNNTQQHPTRQSSLSPSHVSFSSGSVVLTDTSLSTDIILLLPSSGQYGTTNNRYAVVPNTPHKQLDALFPTHVKKRQEASQRAQNCNDTPHTPPNRQQSYKTPQNNTPHHRSHRFESEFPPRQQHTRQSSTDKIELVRSFSDDSQKRSSFSSRSSGQTQHSIQLSITPQHLPLLGPMINCPPLDITNNQPYQYDPNEILDDQHLSDAFMQSSAEGDTSFVQYQRQQRQYSHLQPANGMFASQSQIIPNRSLLASPMSGPLTPTLTSKQVSSSIRVDDDGSDAMSHGSVESNRTVDSRKRRQFNRIDGISYDSESAPRSNKSRPTTIHPKMASASISVNSYATTHRSLAALSFIGNAADSSSYVRVSAFLSSLQHRVPILSFHPIYLSAYSPLFKSVKCVYPIPNSAIHSPSIIQPTASIVLPQYLFSFLSFPQTGFIPFSGPIPTPHCLTSDFDLFRPDISHTALENLLESASLSSPRSIRAGFNSPSMSERTLLNGWSNPPLTPIDPSNLSTALTSTQPARSVPNSRVINQISRPRAQTASRNDSLSKSAQMTDHTNMPPPPTTILPSGPGQSSRAITTTLVTDDPQSMVESTLLSTDPSIYPDYRHNTIMLLRFMAMLKHPHSRYVGRLTQGYDVSSSTNGFFDTTSPTPLVSVPRTGDHSAWYSLPTQSCLDFPALDIFDSLAQILPMSPWSSITTAGVTHAADANRSHNFSRTPHKAQYTYASDTTYDDPFSLFSLEITTDSQSPLAPSSLFFPLSKHPDITNKASSYASNDDVDMQYGPSCSAVLFSLLDIQSPSQIYTLSRSILDQTSMSQPSGQSDLIHLLDEYLSSHPSSQTTRQTSPPSVAMMSDSNSTSHSQVVHFPMPDGSIMTGYLYYDQSTEQAVILSNPLPTPTSLYNYQGPPNSSNFTPPIAISQYRLSEQFRNQDVWNSMYQWYSEKNTSFCQQIKQLHPLWHPPEVPPNSILPFFGPLSLLRLSTALYHTHRLDSGNDSLVYIAQQRFTNTNSPFYFSLPHLRNTIHNIPYIPHNIRHTIQYLSHFLPIPPPLLALSESKAMYNDTKTRLLLKTRLFQVYLSRLSPYIVPIQNVYIEDGALRTVMPLYPLTLSQYTSEINQFYGVPITNLTSPPPHTAFHDLQRTLLAALPARCSPSFAVNSTERQYRLLSQHLISLIIDMNDNNIDVYADNSNNNNVDNNDTGHIKIMDIYKRPSYTDSDSWMIYQHYKYKQLLLKYATLFYSSISPSSSSQDITNSNSTTTTAKPSILSSNKNDRYSFELLPDFLIIPRQRSNEKQKSNSLQGRDTLHDSVLYTPQDLPLKGPPSLPPVFPGLATSTRQSIGNTSVAYTPHDDGQLSVGGESDFMSLHGTQSQGPVVCSSSQHVPDSHDDILPTPSLVPTMAPLHNHVVPPQKQDDLAFTLSTQTPGFVDFYQEQGLSETVLSSLPLPNKALFHLLYQLAHGLSTIHSNGGIHMDIKPSNILISQNGICSITDFTNVYSQSHVGSINIYEPGNSHHHSDSSSHSSSPVHSHNHNHHRQDQQHSISHPYRDDTHIDQQQQQSLSKYYEQFELLIDKYRLSPTNCLPDTVTAQFNKIATSLNIPSSSEGIAEGDKRYMAQETLNLVSPGSLQRSIELNYSIILQKEPGLATTTTTNLPTQQLPSINDTTVALSHNLTASTSNSLLNTTIRSCDSDNTIQVTPYMLHMWSLRQSDDYTHLDPAQAQHVKNWGSPAFDTACQYSIKKLEQAIHSQVSVPNPMVYPYSTSILLPNPYQMTYRALQWRQLEDKARQQGSSSRSSKDTKLGDYNLVTPANIPFSSLILSQASSPINNQYRSDAHSSANSSFSQHTLSSSRLGFTPHLQNSFLSGHSGSSLASNSSHHIRQRFTPHHQRQESDGIGAIALLPRTNSLGIGPALGAGSTPALGVGSAPSQHDSVIFPSYLPPMPLYTAQQNDNNHTNNDHDVMLYHSIGLSPTIAQAQTAPDMKKDNKIDYINSMYFKRTPITARPAVLAATLLKSSTDSASVSTQATSKMPKQPRLAPSVNAMTNRSWYTYTGRPYTLTPEHAMALLYHMSRESPEYCENKIVWAIRSDDVDSHDVPASDPNSSHFLLRFPEPDMNPHTAQHAPVMTYGNPIFFNNTCFCTYPLNHQFDVIMWPSLYTASALLHRQLYSSAPHLAGTFRLGLSHDPTRHIPQKPGTVDLIAHIPSLRSLVGSVSSASDIFSLGLVLLELITGRTPPNTDINLRTQLRIGDLPCLLHLLQYDVFWHRDEVNEEHAESCPCHHGITINQHNKATGLYTHRRDFEPVPPSTALPPLPLPPLPGQGSESTEEEEVDLPYWDDSLPLLQQPILNTLAPDYALTRPRRSSCPILPTHPNPLPFSSHDLSSLPSVPILSSHDDDMAFHQSDKGDVHDNPLDRLVPGLSNDLFPGPRPRPLPPPPISLALPDDFGRPQRASSLSVIPRPQMATVTSPNIDWSRSDSSLCSTLDIHLSRESKSISASPLVEPKAPDAPSTQLSHHINIGHPALSHAGSLQDSPTTPPPIYYPQTPRHSRRPILQINDYSSAHNTTAPALSIPHHEQSNTSSGIYGQNADSSLPPTIRAYDPICTCKYIPHTKSVSPYLKMLVISMLAPLPYQRPTAGGIINYIEILLALSCANIPLYNNDILSRTIEPALACQNDTDAIKAYESVLVMKALDEFSSQIPSSMNNNTDATHTIHSTTKDSLSQKQQSPPRNTDPQRTSNDMAEYISRGPPPLPQQASRHQFPFYASVDSQSQDGSNRPADTKPPLPLVMQPRPDAHLAVRLRTSSDAMFMRTMAKTSSQHVTHSGKHTPVDFSSKGGHFDTQPINPSSENDTIKMLSQPTDDIKASASSSRYSFLLNRQVPSTESHTSSNEAIISPVYPLYAMNVIDTHLSHMISHIHSNHTAVSQLPSHLSYTPSSSFPLLHHTMTELGKCGGSDKISSLDSATAAITSAFFSLSRKAFFGPVTAPPWIFGDGRPNSRHLHQLYTWEAPIDPVSRVYMHAPIHNILQSHIQNQKAQSLQDDDSLRLLIMDPSSFDIPPLRSTSTSTTTDQSLSEPNTSFIDVSINPPLSPPPRRPFHLSRPAPHRLLGSSLAITLALNTPTLSSPQGPSQFLNQGHLTPPFTPFHPHQPHLTSRANTLVFDSLSVPSPSSSNITSKTESPHTLDPHFATELSRRFSQLRLDSQSPSANLAFLPGSLSFASPFTPESHPWKALFNHYVTVMNDSHYIEHCYNLSEQQSSCHPTLVTPPTLSPAVSVGGHQAQQPSLFRSASQAMSHSTIPLSSSSPYDFIEQVSLHLTPYLYRRPFRLALARQDPSAASIPSSSLPSRTIHKNNIFSESQSSIFNLNELQFRRISHLVLPSLFNPQHIPTHHMPLLSHPNNIIPSKNFPVNLSAIPLLILPRPLLYTATYAGSSVQPTIPPSAPIFSPTAYTLRVADASGSTIACAGASDTNVSAYQPQRQTSWTPKLNTTVHSQNVMETPVKGDKHNINHSFNHKPIPMDDDLLRTPTKGMPPFSSPPPSHGPIPRSQNPPLSAVKPSAMGQSYMTRPLGVPNNTSNGSSHAASNSTQSSSIRQHHRLMMSPDISVTSEQSQSRMQLRPIEYTKTPLKSKTPLNNARAPMTPHRNNTVNKHSMVPPRTPAPLFHLKQDTDTDYVVEPLFGIDRNSNNKFINNTTTIVPPSYDTHVASNNTYVPSATMTVQDSIIMMDDSIDRLSSSSSSYNNPINLPPISFDSPPQRRRYTSSSADGGVVPPSRDTGKGNGGYKSKPIKAGGGYMTKPVGGLGGGYMAKPLVMPTSQSNDQMTSPRQTSQNGNMPSTTWSIHNKHPPVTPGPPFDIPVGSLSPIFAQQPPPQSYNNMTPNDVLSSGTFCLEKPTDRLSQLRIKPIHPPSSYCTPPGSPTASKSIPKRP